MLPEGRSLLREAPLLSPAEVARHASYLLCARLPETSQEETNELHLVAVETFLENVASYAEHTLPHGKRHAEALRTIGEKLRTVALQEPAREEALRFLLDVAPQKLMSLHDALKARAAAPPPSDELIRMATIGALADEIKLLRNGPDKENIWLDEGALPLPTILTGETSSRKQEEPKPHTLAETVIKFMVSPLIPATTSSPQTGLIEPFLLHISSILESNQQFLQIVLDARKETLQAEGHETTGLENIEHITQQAFQIKEEFSLWRKTAEKIRYGDCNPTNMRVLNTLPQLLDAIKENHSEAQRFLNLPDNGETAQFEGGLDALKARFTEAFSHRNLSIGMARGLS